MVSERNPGIANWLETCGHPQGVMMLRWQRLSRDAHRGRRTDGRGGAVRRRWPTRLPHFDENQISADEYTARIADRQVGIARRMIS